MDWRVRAKGLSYDDENLRRSLESNKSDETAPCCDGGSKPR